MVGQKIYPAFVEFYFLEPPKWHSTNSHWKQWSSKQNSYSFPVRQRDVHWLWAFQSSSWLKSRVLSIKIFSCHTCQYYLNKEWLKYCGRKKHMSENKWFDNSFLSEVGIRSHPYPIHTFYLFYSRNAICSTGICWKLLPYSAGFLEPFIWLFN